MYIESKRKSQRTFLVRCLALYLSCEQPSVRGQEGGGRGWLCMSGVSARVRHTVFDAWRYACPASTRVSQARGVDHPCLKRVFEGAWSGSKGVLPPPSLLTSSQPSSL